MLRNVTRPGILAATCAAAGLLAYWTASSEAQSTGQADYLSAGLRGRVAEIKREFSREPIGADNVGRRSRVLWDWINAYSLTGGPVPAQSLMTSSNVEQLLQGRAQGLDGALSS